MVVHTIINRQGHGIQKTFLVSLLRLEYFLEIKGIQISSLLNVSRVKILYAFVSIINI